MKDIVKIVDVCPRDGFQNIRAYIPAELKLAVIDRLADAGVQKIQVTSFVSPKAVPQMADAALVAETALQRHPDTDFFALVPNYRGAKAAVETGLGEVAVVTSLSPTHNLKNIGRTHEQSVDELKRIRDDFPQLRIIQDFATAFYCPFEGKMEISALIDLMGRIYEQGVRAFGLMDTIGAANPSQVRGAIMAAKAAFPDAALEVHIHDTRNMGIINSMTAVAYGADAIQTSLGGLGGCPFAPGASGNTSTEDFVYLLHREGYETGIDFGKILLAAKFLRGEVEGIYSGHHINITADACGC